MNRKTKVMEHPLASGVLIKVDGGFSLRDTAHKYETTPHGKLAEAVDEWNALCQDALDRLNVSQPPRPIFWEVQRLSVEGEDAVAIVSRALNKAQDTEDASRGRIEHKGFRKGWEARNREIVPLMARAWQLLVRQSFPESGLEAQRVRLITKLQEFAAMEEEEGPQGDGEVCDCPACSLRRLYEDKRVTDGTKSDALDALRELVGIEDAPGVKKGMIAAIRMSKEEAERFGNLMGKGKLAEAFQMLQDVNGD